jgi:glucan 1,4-alpha-glucosidase
MKWILSGALALIMGMDIAKADRRYDIISPDRTAKLCISEEQGKLYYELSDDGKRIVNRSEIGIVKDAKYSVIDATTTTNDTSWTPVYGQFRTIRDNHTQLSLDLRAGDQPLTLLARLFNNGAGLRFEICGDAGKPLDYVCQFALQPEGDTYAPRGESEPEGPNPILGKLPCGSVPVVIDRPDLTIALLDSDLYSAKAFESMKMEKKMNSPIIESHAKTKTLQGKTVTPWRVIIFGKTPGDLLCNSVALNLAAPCELEDTTWIKPGKSLWDWRIHDYHNGDFKYGIDTRSYLRMIDFASENTIDYLTIDDHWYGRDRKTKELRVRPEVDIEKVMAYGKDKGVGIILYYDRRGVKTDRKEFNENDKKVFDLYEQLGAAGIKYGFMGDNAVFTRGTVAEAAKRKMFINFHDRPCPMVGISRTLPSRITRENCHAQQDCRRAVSPRSFLKMAMINGLLGSLDQANGNFGIKSINAGERAKGPKKNNSYVSTVVSEVARTLVLYAGLITLPDAPEEYRKKSDLFDFLKQMPATWDETVVPNSKIGEFITTARRTGDTWFVGSVTNDKERELTITFDFLVEGKTYEATLFEDTPESHGVKNPEAYQISKRKISKGDIITARMAVGGGHAMIVRPR